MMGPRCGVLALLSWCAVPQAAAPDTPVRLPTFTHQGRQTNGLRVSDSGEVVHVRGEPVDHTHWETPNRLLTHAKEMAAKIAPFSEPSRCSPPRLCPLTLHAVHSAAAARLDVAARGQGAGDAECAADDEKIPRCRQTPRAGPVRSCGVRSRQVRAAACRR